MIENKKGQNMDVFKTIGASLKAFKATKEVCCNNLEKSLVELEVSLKERSKKQKIELDKRYKQLFEDYKNRDDFTNSKDLLDFMNGKLSKDEYEKKKIEYQQAVKQAISDVESAKISHKNFFDIAFKEERK